MGRVARVGIAIGSGGIGGNGRDGGRSGARNDKCGPAVLKSGEIRVEVEGTLEDRAAWAFIWSTSGEDCARGFLLEMLATARAEGC